MPRNELRNFLRAVGWACVATWCSVVLLVLIMLTTAVLVATWYNALKGHTTSALVEHFKLGVATALFILAMSGVVYTVCVGYCRLLAASTALPSVRTVDISSLVVPEARAPSPSAAQLV